MGKIPIVKVTLTNSPDYITTADNWNAKGKLSGLIKSGEFLNKNIEEIEYYFMSEDEFKSLEKPI